MKQMTDALRISQELDIALTGALDSADHLTDSDMHLLALTMIYTKLLDAMQEVADQMPHDSVMKIMLVKEAGLITQEIPEEKLN